ncbi:unnamed protein product [Cuscuta epithymum]|uniref:Uncharacterized protein n=1 Tax=Cuscuta epithymum TaxID=186058 RepID=A0AAV0BXV9_9ASTE|nr:unnamed protein product [Cuscuta epithymum]
MATQSTFKKAKITLRSFYKPSTSTQSRQELNVPIETPNISSTHEEVVSDTPEIERDPGKRKKISDWPFEKRDEIRRSYLMLGPYQPKLNFYKGRVYKDRVRRFQATWFNEFNWLEYSPTTHKAY